MHRRGVNSGLAISRLEQELSTPVLVLLLTGFAFLPGRCGTGSLWSGGERKKARERGEITIALCLAAVDCSGCASVSVRGGIRPVELGTGRCRDLRAVARRGNGDLDWRGCTQLHIYQFSAKFKWSTRVSASALTISGVWKSGSGFTGFLGSFNLLFVAVFFGFSPNTPFLAVVPGSQRLLLTI